MNRFTPFVFVRGKAAGHIRAAGQLFLFASAIAFSGCGVFQDKVDLKKIPVVSIEAVQANGPGMAPGEKSPLVVTVTQANGKKLTTEGKGKGPVRWRDLAVTSTIASANAKGVLALSKDPRDSQGTLPHVTIAVPSHPDVKAAELDVPVRYDRNFNASFAGPSGSNGLDGQDGTTGSSGSMGSTDPDHPSAGGDGSNGGNGSDGDNGRDGGDGPTVHILVAIYDPPPQISNSPGQAGTTKTGHMLQVKVTSGKTERLFLVDPNGGSLTVTSVGGSGGSGGRGGRGGRGGSGGSGIPSGRDGMNGSDGQSGLNGRDGNGGPIFVTYDPRVKPYLGAIQLRNPGGPAPVIKEGPVGPLW